MQPVSAALLLCLLAAGAAQAQTTVSGPVTFGSGLSVSGAGVVSIATGGVGNTMLANPSLTLGATVLTLGGATASVAGLTLTGASLDASDLTSGTVAPVRLGGAASGFVNRLRNAGLTQWYGGSGALSVGTGGGWGAEGIFILPTGAAVTAQQVANGLSGPLTVFSQRITEAGGVTGLVVRFVVDGDAAAPLVGRTVTFQVPILNSTGGTITPTLTVKHAGARDDFSSPTTDIAAVALQPCADGATCVLAYAFNAAAASASGLSLDIDFGNNFAGGTRSIEIGGGFDLRATPGVTTGLNAAPPPPEIPAPATEARENGRFFRSSYDNGTAPGTVTGAGADEIIASGSTAGKGVGFGAAMRCHPTVTVYSPATGAAGQARDLQNAADVAATIAGVGQAGFVWSASPFSGSAAVLSEHWTADCRISGA